MNKAAENALVLVGPVKPSQNRIVDVPLPMDEPEMNTSGDPITIDLTAIETRIETPHDEAMHGAASAPPHVAEFTSRWRSFAPLAASLVVAALVGAIGGGGVIYGTSSATPAANAAAVALADENRALRENIASLSAELASLKSGIDALSRTTANQFGKVGERLERAEKAQAEPAAKLVKLTENVDKLERRLVSAAAADVTGSVTTIEKQQTKPGTVEGWRLVDYYAGRAVLENRNGTLFEVGPGANLPGLGKIETIKRTDGKVVVTTPKGLIVSELQSPQPQRRPAPYYLPRGY